MSRMPAYGWTEFMKHRGDCRLTKAVSPYAAFALLLAFRTAAAEDASPIYGVRIPTGYRQWELVSVAREVEPLNELRAILGNAVALDAYQAGAIPFPDGSVLVKLAWKHVPSSIFDRAFVPGAPTTVQVMVKDSKKYAASGGWGFGRFRNGEPVDEAQHRTCFACHAAHVKDNDLVFTRLAK